MKAPRPSYSRCHPCGKVTYPTRSATKAGRVPGEHLTPYRCPASTEWTGQLWHLGHIPAAVLHGRRQRY